jgi:hypothetical protein
MIIPFDQRRRAAAPPPRRPQAETVKDILGQELLREYAAWPIEVVEAAVNASRAMIDQGGSFIDAMEAADRVIRTWAPGPDQSITDAARNFTRIMLYRRRRARMVEAIMKILEPRVRARMAGHVEANIADAIARARRVLEGGGDYYRAMFRAVGDFPTESA